MYGMALITPGADMAITIANSLQNKRKVAFFSAFGTACAHCFYSTFALLGVAILIQQTPQLFQMLQIVGAGYLVFLGVQNLYKAQKKKALFDIKHGVLTPIIAFRRAFFVGLSNPMVIIFFISIFSAVLKPTTSNFEKTLLNLAVSVMAFSWFATIAFCVTYKKTQTMLNKNIAWVERITGVVLVILGVKLIF